MLKLSSCTAVCVDTENHELAQVAADWCSSCEFKDLLIFSDKESRYETKSIRKLAGIEDYGRFIFSELINYVETEHVLIFQWDGFIINPSAWSDQFLVYDYIGAPWPRGMFGQEDVGNGGFSIRSRKLLEITAGSRIDPGQFEDVTVANQISRKYTINIAPVALARRFSFEMEPIETPTFGFHGHFNLPRVLDVPNILKVLDLAPDSFWQTDKPLSWIDDAWKDNKKDLAVEIYEYCRDKFPLETAGWPKRNLYFLDILKPGSGEARRMNSGHLDKTAVIVLGMHRSGTSAITNMVVELGAKAGKTLIPASDQNEAGYWESVAVLKLNDSALASLNASWDSCLPLNELALTPKFVKKFHDEAVSVIEQEFAGEDFIVVKDPRICLLYPLWRNSITSAGYFPKVVIVIRRPLEVARSLQVRDGMSIGRGVLLWLRHNLQAEWLSRGEIRSVILYENSFGLEEIVAERLGLELEIQWPKVAVGEAYSGNRVFKEDLRHHAVHDQVKHDGRLFAMAQICFEALTALSDDPSSVESGKTLDMLRDELDVLDAYQTDTIADLQKDAVGALRRAGHSIKEWVDHGDQLGRDLEEARAQQGARAQQVSTLVEHCDKLGQDLDEARSQRDAHSQSSTVVMRHAAELENDLADARAQRDAYLRALTVLTHQLNS